MRMVLNSWLPDHRFHIDQLEAAQAVTFFQSFVISRGEGWTLIYRRQVFMSFLCILVRFVYVLCQQNPRIGLRTIQPWTCLSILQYTSALSCQLHQCTNLLSHYMKWIQKQFKNLISLKRKCYLSQFMVKWQRYRYKCQK